MSAYEQPADWQPPDDWTLLYSVYIDTVSEIIPPCAYEDCTRPGHYRVVVGTISEDGEGTVPLPCCAPHAMHMSIGCHMQSGRDLFDQPEEPE